MKGRIEIRSITPYQNRLPNRKLLSLESLTLLKYLKENGYEVVVLPEDDRPLEYLFKKGVREIIGDPVYLILIGIPIAIGCNLISNWLQKLIYNKDKRFTKKKIHIDNVIIKIKEINKYYRYDGKEFDQEMVKQKRIDYKNEEKEFSKKLDLISPYFQYPTPIFLEHKPKIVGWVNLTIDEVGLHTKGIIIDKTTRKRMDQGRLKGASVTGIATKTECSICKSNYILCNHISGNFYKGVECIVYIVKADIIEVSLVKEPINPECLISLK